MISQFMGSNFKVWCPVNRIMLDARSSSFSGTPAARLAACQRVGGELWGLADKPPCGQHQLQRSSWPACSRARCYRGRLMTACSLLLRVLCLQQWHGASTMHASASGCLHCAYASLCWHFSYAAYCPLWFRQACRQRTHRRWQSRARRCHSAPLHTSAPALTGLGPPLEWPLLRI